MRNKRLIVSVILVIVIITVSGAKTQAQIAVDSDLGNYYNAYFSYNNTKGESITKNKWKNTAIPYVSSNQRPATLWGASWSKGALLTGCRVIVWLK